MINNVSVGICFYCTPKWKNSDAPLCLEEKVFLRQTHKRIIYCCQGRCLRGGVLRGGWGWVEVGKADIHHLSISSHLQKVTDLLLSQFGHSFGNETVYFFFFHLHTHTHTHTHIYRSCMLFNNFRVKKFNNFIKKIQLIVKKKMMHYRLLKLFFSRITFK